MVLLLALISLAAETDASAQLFKTIHTFSGYEYSSPDGSQPYNTGVVLAGTTLFGTTYYGGANSNGVIFSVNTDGLAFAVLHTFSAALSPAYTNSDGEAPQGSLTLVGDTLFGATLNGGPVPGGYGTIYSIKTNGDSFTLIHGFDGTNGAEPNGPLIIADGKIYGTTANGGAGGYGTVFSMNLDGSEYQVVHAFTNIDGHYPNGVVLSGDTLFGTTFLGGSNGNGVVFSVQTNSDNLTVLHTFSAGNAGYYHQFNDDGMNPQMLPAVSDNTIYGTAAMGGYYDRGTLFSIKTDGSSFNVLRTFADAAPGYERSLVDGGGNFPMGITVSNGVLYGVCEGGGKNDSGVVYAINTNGTHFNVLHTFETANTFTGYTNSGGQYPEGELALASNVLYGACEHGGQGNGTVFSVVVQPTIADLQLAGANVVIHGFNGVAGENCTTLFTSDITLPVTQWMPIATNVLSSGDFTITATNLSTPPPSNGFFGLEIR